MRILDLVVSSPDAELRAEMKRFFKDDRLDFVETVEEVTLRLLDKDMPDALVWDLRGERLSHEEALETIKKICPQLPVLILAWKPRSEPGPRFLHAGKVCVLLQPTSLAVLGTLVEDLVRPVCARAGANGCGVDHAAIKERLYQQIEAKSVFEHLPVPGIVVAEDRTVLAMNRRARRLTSSSAEETLGRKTCRELCQCRIPDDDCPLLRAFASRETEKARVAMCPGGRERVFVEQICAFRNPITGDREAAIIYLSPS